MRAAHVLVAIGLTMSAPACASMAPRPPDVCTLVDQLEMRAEAERTVATREEARAAELWVRRSDASDSSARQAEERAFRRDARAAEDLARAHFETAERYTAEATSLAAELRAEGTHCPQ